MITRNNVPKHNGTRMCLLGRSGPREFRAIAPRHIAPRHGALVRGVLVRGMGIWSEAWGRLVRGMFGPRHGELVRGMGIWSEACLVRGMGRFGPRLGAGMAHGIGSE